MSHIQSHLDLFEIASRKKDCQQISDVHKRKPNGVMKHNGLNVFLVHPTSISHTYIKSYSARLCVQCVRMSPIFLAIIALLCESEKTQYPRHSEESENAAAHTHAHNLLTILIQFWIDAQPMDGERAKVIYTCIGAMYIFPVTSTRIP